MKILKSSRTGNCYTLEIETAPEIILSAMDSAFKRLSKDSRIPGFRKGKVPRNLFERYYGRDVLIQEAVKDTVNESYIKAIQELKLDVVDFPKNVSIDDYKENTPLIFRCEVDVKPEIEVKNYKGLKAKKAAGKADQAAIDEHILKIRENFAEFNVAQEASADGDIVMCHFETTVEGQPYERWTRKNIGLEIGRASFSEAVDNELVGLKPGEKKSFDVPFNDKFPNKEVAGKTVHFEAEMAEVRKRTLPELNDALVAKISSFKTVEEFTQNVKENLEKKLDDDSQAGFQQALVDQLVEQVKIEIPEGMIERDTAKYLDRLEDSLKQSGIRFEDYVKVTQKNVDDIKKDYRETSIKNIKSELVLEAVAKAENLQISNEEIKDVVRSWNLPSVKNEDDLNKILQQIDSDKIRFSLLQKKAIDFISENAKAE